MPKKKKEVEINDIELEDDLDNLDDLDDLDLNDNLNILETSSNSDKLDEKSLSFFKNISVEISVEIATKKIPLSQLMEMNSNEVIMLDKYHGDSVDILVNGDVFATAEIVSNGTQYGFRLLEIVKKQ